MAGGWNDEGRSKRRALASRMGRVRVEMTGVLRANIRNAAREIRGSDFKHLASANYGGECLRTRSLRPAAIRRHRPSAVRKERSLPDCLAIATTAWRRSQIDPKPHSSCIALC